jgi:hypothetical protein
MGDISQDADQHVLPFVLLKKKKKKKLLIFVKGQKGEKRTGAWSKASDHLQDTRSSLGWKNIKSKKTFGEYISISLSLYWWTTTKRDRL